ncbi:MAG: transcriptional repressor [Proteobacteria bacterium]|nr:transcriptional repressor [Pseudomonadota bacterium]
MCQQCDYRAMLEDSGLGFTPRRARVLEVVGNSAAPVSAQDVIDRLRPAQAINRVTVYRILDRLVEYGLIERLSAGDRSFRYGPAYGENHPPHPHFYCTGCGRMECLDMESLGLHLDALATRFSGRVDKIEIRIDGSCRRCLKAGK